MIPALASFVASLRRDGLPVSQAESLDAVAAAAAVGLEDRETLRAALAACLIKHHAARTRFDELFRRHFAAPDLPSRRGSRKRRSARGGDRGRAAVGTSRREGRETRNGDGSRSERRTKPGSFVARAERPPREGRRRPRLQRAVARGRAAGRDAAAELRDDPLRRPLDRRFTAAEERLLAEAVPRCVEQIRLRLGRRARRSRRGALHLRALFRANAGHGGVPWVLPRRRRRPRRRRVLVLVDVSWSAARAAGLFLTLAAAFVERSARTRVVLFVDRPVEATAEVERWLAGRCNAGTPAAGATAGRRQPDVRPGRGLVRGGVSFADLLDGIAGVDLAAPSDYGRVFDGVPRTLRGFRGRDTVLVVLGDGRTNRFDPQVWRFEELAGACGAVLWLVPEPRGRWGTADSALGGYLPHVDVAVEAHDLEGLALGVAEWVRRL